RNNIDSAQAEWDSAFSDTGALEVSKQTKGADGGPVDLDYVADDGTRWVEVKNTNPFGVETTQWADLSDKVRRMQDTAQLPQNLIDGRPPRIEVRFLKGVSPEVANELRGLGVVVTDREG